MQRVAMFLLWTGCVVPVEPVPRESAAAAITNGRVDEVDTAVVALLSDGSVFCSGALIAPDAVLTAAHCVASDPPDEVSFATSPVGGGDVVSVVAVVPHPTFDPELLTDDIALVRLAEDVGFAPLPLLGETSSADLVGRPARIVGFGLTSATAPAAEPVRRRSGTTTIADADEVTFRFGPEPSQTCLGDSGGPTFVLGADGRERLAGVHSAGDPDCAWTAIDTRVDAYAESFLAPELSAATSAALPAGGELVGHCSAARGSADGWPFVLAFVVLVRRQRKP